MCVPVCAVLCCACAVRLDVCCAVSRSTFGRVLGAHFWRDFWGRNILTHDILGERYLHGRVIFVGALYLRGRCIYGRVIFTGALYLRARYIYGRVIFTGGLCFRGCFDLGGVSI